MIAEIVDEADLFDFRPIIYAIPFVGVSGRVELVAGKRRASIEPEYVIPDLKLSEFQAAGGIV